MIFQQFFYTNFVFLLEILVKTCPLDIEAQFQQAIKSNNMSVAYDVAINYPEYSKWMTLRELARKNKKMDLSQNCHLHMIGHIKGKMLNNSKV